MRRSRVLVGVFAVLCARTARADDPKPLPIALHGGTAFAVTGDEPASIAITVERLADVQLRAQVVGVARVDRVPNPSVGRDVPVTGAAVDVPAGGRVVLPVAADEPGIYDVEAEVRDPAHAFLPAYVHATIYRRAAWWWAALWIALGAIVAAGIRAWLDGGKARLDARTRLATLRVSVDETRRGYRADALIDAASGLAGSIAALDTQVRARGDLAVLGPAIDRAERRFALLQAVAAALPDVQRLAGAARARAQTGVDAALVAVRADDAGIDAAITAFQAIDFDAVFHDQIAAAIASLQAQLAALPPGADRALAAALDPARIALAAARAALDRGETDAANTELGRAQPLLLGAFADELGRLVGADAPLPGVDAARWAGLRVDVLASLAIARADGDWDARIAALAAAQAAYTTTAIDGLLALARANQAPSAQARLAEIIADLTAAKADPQRAARLYAPYREELAKLAAPKVAAGPVSTEAQAAPAAAPVGLASGVALVAIERGRSPARLATPRALSLAGASATLLVNVVVLAVGVCSGIKALYAGEPAWGGAEACLTAFLWGASVQVAGNAFVGLRAFAQKIGVA